MARMTGSGSFKQWLKEPAKELATRCLNYHIFSSMRDILILSSPRSGSTWLMFMLSTHPRTIRIGEPLNQTILNMIHILPIVPRQVYTSLSPHESSLLKSYFKNRKPIGHFGHVDLLSRNYSFVTDRRVFKVIRATPLIEWFLEQFDFHIVYLLRHPIAQSMSSIERGHPSRLRNYMTDTNFTNAYLKSDLKEALLDIMKHGTKLEKYVAEWCLDNIAPLDLLKKKTNRFLAITYEELSLRPVQMSKILHQRLNLRDFDGMQEQIRVPSRVTDSSTIQTKTAIADGDSKYLINKWERRISRRTEHELFEIIEGFGIDAYQEGELMPNKCLIHVDEGEF